MLSRLMGPYSNWQLALTHKRSVIIEAKRDLREQERNLFDLIQEKIPESLRDELEKDAIIMANARAAARGTRRTGDPDDL